MDEFELDTDVAITEDSDIQDEGVSELEEVASELDDLPEVELDFSVEGPERRSFLENLEDTDLFANNSPGEYHYRETEDGKSAWGSLELTGEGVRNAEAQRLAGGEFREAKDDGGHLIGTRFGGSPELENIDAQNRNLNRGAYKAEENSWASSLEDGNQVFVNVDTYKSNGSDRPSAYMGYKIEEDTEGNRSWDAFSFTNVSSQEQKEWEELDALYDELEMKENSKGGD